MISWIVASHREDILRANLLATLKLEDQDELIVMRDQPSITIAYAQAQKQATQPVRCYVQHDIQIHDMARLRSDLIFFTEMAGMVGLVGGCTPLSICMPWWVGGELHGSIGDPRHPDGGWDFGSGGSGALVVDGAIMATRMHVDWDISWPGWHGYDHDACAQMVAQGLLNMVIPDGRKLVTHNTGTQWGVVEHSSEWADAVARFNQKWKIR